MVLLAVPGRILDCAPPDLHQWEHCDPGGQWGLTLGGLAGSPALGPGLISLLLKELYHAKFCFQLPTKVFYRIRSVLSNSPAIKWREKACFMPHRE